MVRVVIAIFCDGGVLPRVLFVCLPKVGLKIDVGFFNGRLGSPFATRLSKNDVDSISAIPVLILLVSVIPSFPRTEKA